MFAFLLSFALADAVDNPPERCPPGAVGETSHAGAWCQASVCDPALCRSGYECTDDVGLCIESSVVPCGGLRPDDDTCTIEKREAHGSCRTQADCAVGTCELAKRCVQVGPSSSGSAHGGTMPAPLQRVSSCGCNAARTSLASTGLGVLLLGLLAGRRRR